MTEQALQQTAHALKHLQDRIGKVVLGSEHNTRLAFIAYLVKGHLLLEGVPGVGKTLLARCFSKSMGLSMRRIQCTPDLMPGDVVGANIFNFQTQTFSLTKGPVFTPFLLADEINRTPPKTQSALLEAMQERSVTIDGTTHPLPEHFMMVATQNPVEHEGTYPLPEAQLDRFLFKLVVGYPDENQEVNAVIAHCGASGMPDLDTLPLDPIPENVLPMLRQSIQSVRIEPKIAHYVVQLARATRNHPAIGVGLSPRAATMIAAAARANAACEARLYVLPDDIKALFVAAARHRVLVTPAAEMDDVRSEDVLAQVIQQVPAPR